MHKVYLLMIRPIVNWAVMVFPFCLALGKGKKNRQES